MYFPPLPPTKINRKALSLAGLIFLMIANCGKISADPQVPDPPSASVPVFITDFELASVSVKPVPSALSPKARDQQKPPEQIPLVRKPNAPVVYQDEDGPSVQARRLMDFFATTLVETLQKKGYNATRTRNQTPSNGALLRGVFAEPDAKNRIRRSLLGGTSSNPRFLLYVGIFNLARPDQPLYQLAPAQSASSQYGPVITLNSFIPLAKYELDKNPSEEDVQKICAQIAASLNSLLASNSAAFSN